MTSPKGLILPHLLPLMLKQNKTVQDFSFGIKINWPHLIDYIFSIVGDIIIKIVLDSDGRQSNPAATPSSGNKHDYRFRLTAVPFYK